MVNQSPNSLTYNIKLNSRKLTMNPYFMPGMYYPPFMYPGMMPMPYPPPLPGYMFDREMSNARKNDLKPDNIKR